MMYWKVVVNSAFDLTSLDCLIQLSQKDPVLKAVTYKESCRAIALKRKDTSLQKINSQQSPMKGCSMSMTEMCEEEKKNGNQHHQKHKLESPRHNFTDFIEMNQPRVHSWIPFSWRHNKITNFGSGGSPQTNICVFVRARPQIPEPAFVHLWFCAFLDWPNVKLSESITRLRLSESAEKLNCTWGQKGFGRLHPSRLLLFPTANLSSLMLFTKTAKRISYGGRNCLCRTKHARPTVWQQTAACR